MSLAPGVRLGAYEVSALIGAGGMGQVYRAKDSKLGREVALKILPDTFTHDPDRLGRFRREAQVLASLNHPRIGAIYGVDECIRSWKNYSDAAFAKNRKERWHSIGDVRVDPGSRN
jgi:serine/threonine protein kinase